MPSDIVIIISNKTNDAFCNINQRMIDLGLDDFCEKSYIAAIRNFENGKCLENINEEITENYDLLFLSDIDFSNVNLENNYKNIIGFFTKGEKQIYILFHANVSDPILPESQLKFMNNLLGYKFRKLFQSHIDGSIYCNDLKQLANAVSNKDKNTYDSVLARMKEKFPDDAKEKILILLHDCLSPKGAIATDKSFLTKYQKEIVDFLAQHNDNLATDYIEKLTELRISLLGY